MWRVLWDSVVGVISAAMMALAVRRAVNSSVRVIPDGIRATPRSASPGPSKRGYGIPYPKSGRFLPGPRIRHV